MSPDDQADHYVDITDTFDRKIAALRAHTSQTAHMTTLEERMRAWSALQACPRADWPKVTSCSIPLTALTTRSHQPDHLSSRERRTNWCAGSFTTA